MKSIFRDARVFISKRKVLCFYVALALSVLLGTYISQYGFQIPTFSQNEGRLIDLNQLSLEGCSLQGTTLTVSSEDPKMVGILLNQGERNICMNISSMTASDKVQVFFSSDGTYSEQSSITESIKVGKNIFCIPDSATMLRIDLGTKKGLSFQLDSIEVSKSPFLSSSYALRSICLVVLVLIIAIMLRNCDAIYGFYKRHKFIVIWSVICFSIYSIWSLILPFNTGPDESMRYDIVKYIVTYNKLPRGDDPILLSNNVWGTSYAFSPYLAYIIDAGIAKIFAVLGFSMTNLFHVARFGSVIYGTVTVVFTYKSACLLFNKKIARMASIFVGALPEFAFLSAYVNNDSLALMSISMIIYAWICGMRNDWKVINCMGVGAAVSVCFLSYKNSYGYILCTAVLFIAYYIRNSYKEKSWKKLFVMVKKGLIICGIVAICAGWWLVYQYIIYDGDITATAARAWAKANYMSPEIGNMLTMREQGVGVLDMIFKRGFLVSSIKSFFAGFDYLSLWIPRLGYILYVLLFGVGIGISFFALVKKIVKKKIHAFRCILYGNLLLACVITIFLSIYYSYNVDYQAQGRYVMPILIPVSFAVSYGVNYIAEHAKNRQLHLLPQVLEAIYVFGCVLILAAVVIPYYVW